MHETTDRLKRILRAESCPDRVLVKVQAAIAQDRASRSVAAHGRLIGLAAAMVLLIACMFASWFSGVSPVQDLPVAPAKTLTRAQVLDETHLSLACIGAALIEAGDRSETILLNHVKPRLYVGLEKAANAITQSKQP